MYPKTTLKNGLRIVTCPMKDRDSVSLGIFIGVGGRYEIDRLKGAAHFLEHIVFKGSKKYSCEEIKQNIEGIGGALNAFTSEEQTCYYAKIPAKHLASTFDVLSDMVFAPQIAQKDVEKESGVIIEELKMYHDLPQYMVMELLDKLMWPDHPLGKNLAGTAETVGAMTYTDLKQFHQDFYSPGNIVVAAAGHLNHEAFVKLVEKRLKGISAKSVEGFVEADNSQSKPRTQFFKKDIEQMHLGLGMLGLEEGHKDRYVLSVLNVILGGNMSSRLFHEIREKRGLAYSIGSGAKAYKDTGIFLVRAGVDNHKIVQATEVIISELNRIKHTLVSTDELRRAKEYTMGQLMLAMEEAMEHMLWIGEETAAFDKIRTLKEIVTQIDKVTAADVKRLANEVLNEGRFNLAVVGPITDEQQKSLEKILL